MKKDPHVEAVMGSYNLGWNEGVAAVVAMLQEYSVVARQDKRYQAANFLNAAAYKAMRLAKPGEIET